MNLRQAFIAITILSIFAVAFVIPSCTTESGGGDDDDKKSPKNPYAPGTPECDRTCLEWNDQWALDCLYNYLDCSNGCEDSFDSCVEDATARYEDCGKKCNGCLKQAIQCDNSCGESESCLMECGQGLYECDGWNVDCYLQCYSAYDSCTLEALGDQETVQCIEAFVDCKIPCRN